MTASSIHTPETSIQASSSDHASLLRPALTLFLALSLLTGIAYPLLVTAVSRSAFPQAARGSLVWQDGQVIGSRLIGQSFTSPAHFWGRPSATTPTPYNGALSTGANLGPTNPALIDAVKARVAALRAAEPGNTRPIPIDLVTTSASGLDPDISKAAADYQVPRVARATGLPVARVQRLVDQHALGTGGGLFDMLGEPRVNVLALNLALDTAAERR